MSRVPVSTSRYTQELEDDPVVFAAKLYTAFLQGVFNFAEGEFHYDPDGDSTIDIRSGPPKDIPDVTRPAITIITGPTNETEIGIDGMRDFNMTTSKRVRTTLVSGYLLAYCIARNPVVAQRLAHIVRHATRTYQRILESAGGFHRIGRDGGITVNSQSPPGAFMPGDAHGLVMVQVNVPFHLQWTWQTEPNRTSPQHTSIAMVLQELRARDYPYVPPVRLEKVKISFIKRPVVVQRFSRCQPMVESAEGVLFETDLRPFSLDEQE